MCLGIGADVKAWGCGGRAERVHEEEETRAHSKVCQPPLGTEVG